MHKDVETDTHTHSDRRQLKQCISTKLLLTNCIKKGLTQMSFLSFRCLERPGFESHRCLEVFGTLSLSKKQFRQLKSGSCYKGEQNECIVLSMIK